MKNRLRVVVALMVFVSVAMFVTACGSDRGNGKDDYEVHAIHGVRIGDQSFGSFARVTVAPEDEWTQIDQTQFNALPIREHQSMLVNRYFGIDTDRVSTFYGMYLGIAPIAVVNQYVGLAENLRIPGIPDAPFWRARVVNVERFYSTVTIRENGVTINGYEYTYCRDTDQVSLVSGTAQLTGTVNRTYSNNRLIGLTVGSIQISLFTQ